MPLLKALPFGLQHVLAMFVSNITPVIILANVVGLDSALSAVLIQNCMVIAGIGTFIQLYPLWRIGSRLPIVKGISFTFLSLAIFIATSHGMGVLVGAVIIGGIFEGLLGLFAKYWVRIAPPVVAASVVTAIGFSLLPIGTNSFAGGMGSASFGSAEHWIVGSFTLLVCLGFQVFAKGTVRSLSVLIGLVSGYVLATLMGMTSLSFPQGVGIVSLPTPLPFKPEFDLGAILSILAIFLVSATETIGGTNVLCFGALHRAPTERELGAGITCDGFVSSLSGLFGCTPVTSYSQNIGITTMSGVVNRFAIATSAAIIILCGIFPAVGAVLTTIPQAVLGGCTLMMFGSIMVTGFSMLAKSGFTPRNMIIVSLALSVGLGFTRSPEMFNVFPQLVRTVFAENCVALVFVLAVVLNLILPKDESRYA